MNSFQIFSQILNTLNQLYQDSVTSLLKDCQQSTLWISNTAEMPISEVTLHETKTEVILRAYLSEVQLNTVNVKIAHETVLLEGEWDKSSVEGYFYPSRFQSLIPLPYSVNPQTIQAEIKPGVLTVRFPKSAKIKPSRVEIQLKQPNLVVSPISNLDSKVFAR
jgi:HSP20 family protein